MPKAARGVQPKHSSAVGRVSARIRYVVRQYDGPATLVIDDEREFSVQARFSYGIGPDGLGSWRGMLYADLVASEVFDATTTRLRVGALVADIIVDRYDLAHPHQAHFIGSGPPPLSER